MSNWGMVLGAAVAALYYPSVLGNLACITLFGFLWLILTGYRLPARMRPFSGRRYAVKLWGLAVTVAVLCLVYLAFPEWQALFFAPAREVIASGWLPSLLAAVIYLGLFDGRGDETAHGFYQVGRACLGLSFTRSAVWLHVRTFAVRLFFVPLMLVWAASLMGQVVALRFPGNVVELVHGVATLAYYVDVSVGLAGYVVGCAGTGAAVQGVEWRLFGWFPALICYPPFNDVIGGHWLRYEDGITWATWLAGSWWLYPWAAGLILLLAVYAWSTVALGFRFSNLTVKGSICWAGPYKVLPHPAYLSKNMYWWLLYVPWVADSWAAALVNCLHLAIWNGIYYWRAKSEEGVLLAVYPREYSVYRKVLARRFRFRRFRPLVPVSETV
jgi:hypothetical protein